MDRLERLLYTMRDVRDCADPVVDEIDELVAADPAHSRAVILAYTGDEVTRLWALGRLGDPLDLPTVAAALTDPALRHVAMESLGGIHAAAGFDGGGAGHRLDGTGLLTPPLHPLSDVGQCPETSLSRSA
ncbi:hypothetical protein ACQEVZ_53590 [Dactylosporangium sp. CA-152071]|uniref:hypothetical protein n=1 Tax=Dactylosporangium sp. CA-152071 TaxID=3239933 RepID=UPI003D921FA7